MDNFQTSIDLILKSLLRLGELHLHLYQLNALKILNSEQLSKSPYINDEIAVFRAELLPIKHEIEIVSDQAKQVIESFPSISVEEAHFAMLCRMITRAMEVISTICEQEVQYYHSYNHRFREKCTRMLTEIEVWSACEVARVLYKYFRHIALMQLQRYQEILDCMDQNDFESIKLFKEYFYQALQKKESQKKEIKQLLHAPVNSVQINHSPQIHSLKLIDQPPANQQNQQVISSQPVLQIKVETTAENVDSQTRSSSTIPSVEPQSKSKINAKSIRKIHVLLSSVMDLKKEHPNDFITRHWEQKSLYSDLIGRNKPNQQQISSYYHYTRQMNDHLNRTDPNMFFYYREQVNPESFKIDPEPIQLTKTIKVLTGRQKGAPLTVQPRRKEATAPLLSLPFDKRKESRIIHRSIECKPRIEAVNFESKEALEQKPLKIDSQFLEINLRKIIPARRQSQMEQMVMRASSLTLLRNEHHKRFQVHADNPAKIDYEVFKSVRILHQSQTNPKALKDVRERLSEHSHHNRIENRIKEQLRHAELLQGRPQELKKRIILKKY